MLTNAVVRLERREDFAREIGALWKRAQATFLTIGQYLNQAKDRLPHGEFNAMIERDLPFGSKTAHQIRAASAAVQSGRLPATQLPPNYTTLYYLSTLPDAALEQARRDGLLRPDLRRAEVVAFKARFQRVIEGEPDPGHYVRGGWWSCGGNGQRSTRRLCGWKVRPKQVRSRPALETKVFRHRLAWLLTRIFELDVV